MYGIGKIDSHNLNLANILSKVNEYSLYRYYLNRDFKVGGTINSPFRRDKRPSFCVFSYISQDFTLRWKDFSTGESGSIIDLIMKFYGCKFYDTLKIINTDFNLGLISGFSEVHSPLNLLGYENKAIETNSFIKKDTTIEVCIRRWNNTYDKQRWSMHYGITCQTLQYFDVYPLEAFWINGNLQRESRSNPIYGYYFGDNKWKIYQPENQYFKWISNVNKSIIQGEKQLPKEGELLIITKSLKDVMCYYELEINAIAPQSETTLIDINKFVYKNKIINFDFDYTGIKYGNLYRNLYNIPAFYFTNGRFNTIDYKAKDLSDYIKLKGKSKTKELINNIIKNNYEKSNSI